MGRPRKASAELTSIEGAGIALHQLLLAEVELEKYSGALDLARAEASAKFESEINAEKQRIADLTLQLKTFYMSRHEELETEGRKSVKLAYGTIGRRKGNKKLEPLDRSWTWAAIGIKIRSLWPGKYFLAPPEPAVDRDLIKQDLNDEQLKACGLKVTQEETFFAETDRSVLGEHA